MRRSAAVRFADGSITDIVPTKFAHSMCPDADLVDCKGRVVTPGLIDCHTHLVYAGDRCAEFCERLYGASYKEAAKQGKGIQVTVAHTRSASPTALFEQSARRLNKLLAEGVTTVEIKTGYGLDVEAEQKMLNVACELEVTSEVKIHKTFLGAHAVPLEFGDDSDAYIDYVCEEMLPKLHATGKVDAVDAFCETVGFSLQQVKRVITAAQALGLPIKLHAEQLSNSGGARLAAQFGALSVDHLEYLDPADAPYLSKQGTTAVLLPGAYYYLREHRLPPIDALRASNVRIAIATDCNPGSSPICSLLTVMNMACVLFGLTPEESIAGVTRNAAHALGQSESTGTIEVGKQADLVLWDIRDPAELCYALGDNRCMRTWVNGIERP